MNKLLTGFFLFCIYALLARYHFVCKIMHHCDGENKVTSLQKDRIAGLKLLFNNNKAVFDGFEQFIFEQGATDPIVSPNNQTFLQKLSEYMQQNPSKILTLTGAMRWSESDTKPSGFDNVGMARAAAIKKMLIDRGVTENKIEIAADTNPNIDGTMPEPIRFSVQE